MRPYFALLRLMLAQFRYMLPWMKPLSDTEDILENDVTRRSLLARLLGRAERLRPLDTGSDGGPGLGLGGIDNAYYSAGSYGFTIVESPKQATLIPWEGPVCINMLNATKAVFDQMPTESAAQRRVVLLGDDVRDGGIYRDSYAVKRLDEIDYGFTVVGEVPGIAPSPKAILQSLVKLPGFLTRDINRK